MRLLVLLVVLSFVSLHQSASVGNSLDLLNGYHPKIVILTELLNKNCPGYIQQNGKLTELQKWRLQTTSSYLHYLEQQLLECQRDKSVFTTRRSTAAVTDPAPLCPSYVGDSIFDMLLISYNNPTNKKATGVLCRTDGSPCSISLEICVSPINSKSCEFYHQLTDVVGEKSKTAISNNFGNLTNPVKIHLGDRKWKGARVHITVLERNPGNSFRAYRDVEEFSYELTDLQGSPPKILTLHGKHSTDKSELVVMFTVPCPSPSTTIQATPTTPPTTPTTLPTTPTTPPTTPTTPPTTPTTLPTTSTSLPTTPTTLPTTPTTLPTTTTSPPVPAECLTANNLTQPWRLEHNGRNYRAGGPHSLFGYACEMYDIGWFRFTGAAGTHMLDKCPKPRSCGTGRPYWTDEKAPQAVGVAAKISIYAVDGRNCKAIARPVKVMRCSYRTAHDLIYRYLGTRVTGFQRCDEAFCGTN